MSKLAIAFEQTLGNTHFDINVELPAKGITAIFGRSGAGKTSLINVVAGLTKPTAGTIEINGRVLYDSNRSINLPTRARRVGYVFQESRLFPHYRVKGNLLYGVKQSDPVYFEQVVKLLELEPLLTRFPIELSGGEKQRVAIGRALLSKPDILLMDEPLASLDLPRKREVLPFLEHLADNVKVPILYVTHSLNEILRLADHIVVIEDGRVVNSGSIESVWSSNAMRPWQSFTEQSSLFEAQLVEQIDDYALSGLELAEGVMLWVQKVEAKINSRVRLQVRANDVSINLQKPERSSIRNVLHAQIVAIETHSHGSARQSVSVKLELAKNCFMWATITAWARDELELVVGMNVYAQIKGVSVTQRDIALSH
ncbi:molybdate transporter ATP-binding protein [Vibrio ichthyoenteri ATCC 700023]|uniref:Molybdate transporter ATP-binding protein n=1 Tax=Vibrio ichthyoenteri ATCC 700023 TaxID=870968 RepID=F9RXM7_9VIBR|nr:molybdenum ABC transporter ATP-binding protein ModC [Vibrio ichthyoenteri]EGU47807.1 molybdate transporter ATP-binding protein [Vibrio ichthyoenteri ATCC 700023]